MPRLRSVVGALVALLVAFWALAPMAHAMLLLRDTQHVDGTPPVIAGIQTTDVHFYTSSDDNPIPITGWMALAHAQAPTVIVLPGWKDDRPSMLPYASFLVSAGLNVLLIDFRGTGRSGGTFSLGLREPDDVEAAVSYLDTLSSLSNHHYGLFGVSFGAGVAIAAAGGNGGAYLGEPQIRAVVADSPWSTEQRTIDTLNSLHVLGLSIPLLHDAGWAIDQTIGGSPMDRTALAGAAHLQSDQALLIIHSLHDGNSTTPLSDAQALYQAAKAPKEWWLAPLGGHAGAYAAQPAVYSAKVWAFFKRYLVNAKDPLVTPMHTMPTTTRFGH